MTEMLAMLDAYESALMLSSTTTRMVSFSLATFQGWLGKRLRKNLQRFKPDLLWGLLEADISLLFYGHLQHIPGNCSYQALTVRVLCAALST